MSTGTHSGKHIRLTSHPVEGARGLALDGAGADPEQQGGLHLGAILVVPQHEHRPLLWRQPTQGRREHEPRVVIGLHRPLRWRGGEGLRRPSQPASPP